MKNFREVNDDILKEWLEFREENILFLMQKIRNTDYLLMKYLKKY